jgi:hypothetical protein
MNDEDVKKQLKDLKTSFTELLIKKLKKELSRA